MFPFGKSKITGVIWNEFEKKNKKNFQIKKILKKIEIEPLKKEIITFSLLRLYLRKAAVWNNWLPNPPTILEKSIFQNWIN